MRETATLPAKPEFAAIARLGVRALLADIPDEPLADAELVTSEFFTNSVNYSLSSTGGSVEIAVEHEPGSNTARIEVIDAGPLPDPDALKAGQDPDQHGRGVRIAIQLAKVGHAVGRGRQTWWAELSW